MSKRLEEEVKFIIENELGETITKPQAVSLKKYYQYKTTNKFELCLCSREAFIKIYNHVRELLNEH